jgi:2-dehydro-3-deoxyphosphogluconate aldolase / (4S)-4-hydroxy-2-oxoglutarate aldolase
MHKVLQRIGKLKLVPIVVLDQAESAGPLGDALVAGGMPIVEITFRTDGAAEAIATLAKRGDLLVGAGTLLSTGQVDRAIDAGAGFLVAPGTNPRVVEHAQRHSMPILPGVATPTDIELAMSLGLETVKFFPAETMGGVAAIKALAGPYPNMRFMPTGGITPEKLPAYLALPSVLACGGSWMAPRDKLAAGDWGAIRKLIEQTMEILRVVA